MTGTYGGRAYCCTCLYTTSHPGWPLHYVTESSLKYHESDWAHVSSMIKFKGLQLFGVEQNVSAQ